MEFRNIQLCPFSFMKEAQPITCSHVQFS